MNRRVLTILAVALLALPLAGCGDDDSAQPPVHTAHLIRLQPEQDVKVATAASQAPSLGGDPLDSGGDRITQTGDPLDSGGDALAGKDSLGGEDPLSAHGTNNWYWLRGNITGGAMAITVDGVLLGAYTVHMDKEITHVLHPGMNSITFTSQPDNPSIPVQAHLEVVYSQMQPGQVPPLVFDTRNTLKSSVPVLKAPPAVYKPVEGSDDTGSEAIPTIGPVPHGLTVAMPEQPITLTFEAH